MFKLFEKFKDKRFRFCIKNWQDEAILFIMEMNQNYPNSSVFNGSNAMIFKLIMNSVAYWLIFNSYNLPKLLKTRVKLFVTCCQSESTQQIPLNDESYLAFIIKV